MSRVGLVHEANNFWRATSEARRIRRDAANDPTIAQQDDLESIVINSDWGRLKDRAQAAINEFQGRQPAAEEAACESSA